MHSAIGQRFLEPRLAQKRTKYFFRSIRLLEHAHGQMITIIHVAIELAAYLVRPAALRSKQAP
jgi:hypothetical protein